MKLKGQLRFAGRHSFLSRPHNRSDPVGARPCNPSIVEKQCEKHPIRWIEVENAHPRTAIGVLVRSYGAFAASTPDGPAPVRPVFELSLRGLRGRMR